MNKKETLQTIVGTVLGYIFSLNLLAGLICSAILFILAYLTDNKTKEQS